MALQEQSVAEQLVEARERYVARGAGNPKLIVGAARGAVIETIDGREFLDFVGGIGCQNLGHGPEKVVAAVHAQVDRFLHQMSMVVSYEGYVEVCRLLAESSAVPGRVQEHAHQQRRRGDRERRQGLARGHRATGRPDVRPGFHGRTLLAMTMTSKLVYKKTFGPFAPEIYRVPAPYEYRGITSDDAIREIELAFKATVDPESVACAVLEPVQGEGGFIPMPLDFPARLKELLDRYGILYVDDEIQSGCGRTGPMWAIEHYGVAPDLVTSGKTLGGGLPLAAVTGRADVMDAPHIGGLGGTFAGNPVSCAAATVVLEELDRAEVREAATRLGERMRSALDDVQSRVAEIGDVRGLGPMLAIELVTDRKTKEPAADLATRTIAEALDRGLLLMGSGIFSNCIRFLPPLNLEDAQLERGMTLLEESLVAAGATRA